MINHTELRKAILRQILKNYDKSLSDFAWEKVYKQDAEYQKVLTMSEEELLEFAVSTDLFFEFALAKALDLDIDYLFGDEEITKSELKEFFQKLELDIRKELREFLERLSNEIDISSEEIEEELAKISDEDELYDRFLEIIGENGRKQFKGMILGMDLLTDILLDLTSENKKPNLNNLQDLFKKFDD